MTDIVKLVTREEKNSEARASEIAEMLEELMEMTIAGHIAGIQYVVLMEDGSTGSAYSPGCLEDLHGSIAALELLKHRLISIASDRSE